MARLFIIVSIFVVPPMMGHVVEELAKLPCVERLYEVSGEFDVICFVSAAGIEEFRDILVNQIMKIEGIRSTVSDVILSSHPAQR